MDAPALPAADPPFPAIAIVLINLRETLGRVPDDAIRIDRKTRWGNPYAINASTSREEVLRRYRAFLWGRIFSGAIPLEELARLHGKPLACWCHPKPCHGSVLAEASAWADWAVRNNMEKIPRHVSGIALIEDS